MDNIGISLKAETYWLWLAILDSVDTKQLLYAALLPHNLNYPSNTSLDNGSFKTQIGTVSYHSKVVSSEELDKFMVEVESHQTLNFELLDSSLKLSFPIGSKRELLNKTFGKSIVQIQSYYTFPDLSIWNQDFHGLKESLLMLKNELNLPFDQDYSRKLGNFEIHDTTLAVDSLISIDLINTKECKSGKASIRIVRNAPLINSSQKLHVVCRELRDVIFEGLVLLEAGNKVIELDCLTEDSYELECWLFDMDGRLIYQDHKYYAAQIGINMGVSTRQIELNDNLTKKAFQKSPSLGSQASLVSKTHTQRSKVQSKVRECHQFSDQMTQIQSELFQSSGNDRWFGKSIECEVEVIDYFQQLFCKGQASKAIIVDPFFGAEAFERFVTRVEESTLELTILTSLSDINPDSGENFDIENTPINLLKAVISKVQDLINCKLKVINVNRGSSKQAFHDRYLVVYSFDGIPAVYMLSNSINKMSGNWPFCMSKLEPAIAKLVREYIEQLCIGKDNSRDGNPNITFEWPENE